jgi:hypothetical protein
VVQPPPFGFGSHAPFVHVKPAAQGVVSQLPRHCPSAQTFPLSHSLENLQVFAGAVHDPATQAWPLAQSAAAVAGVHGQGPERPPHDSQVPAAHALPTPQSLFVVQSFFVPGSVPGAAQRLVLQISPFAQGTPSEHVVVQPAAVQTDPGAQLEVPVHAVFAGGATVEQPYASHS